jgi:hypothetical protein
MRSLAFCLAFAVGTGIPMSTTFAQSVAPETHKERSDPASSPPGANTRFAQFLAPMAISAAKSVAGSELVQSAVAAAKASLIDVASAYVSEKVAEQANSLLIGKKDGAEQEQVPAKETRPAIDPTAIPAGIAYELLVLQADGSARLTQPSRHVFANGDRFHLRFMTNLPGRIEAFNIDPVGVQTHIGGWTVSGGQPVRLPARGNFKFVGDARGTEILLLQLQPCIASPEAGATRGIVVEEEIRENLDSCADMPMGKIASKRAIVVEEEGATAIAMTTTSASSLKGGKDPIIVSIPLRHN